jgi:DNA-binding protein
LFLIGVLPRINTTTNGLISWIYVSALFYLELIRKKLNYYETVTLCRGQTQRTRQRYTKKQQKGVKKMTENADVIFVGNKPPMSYVLAIITSLSSGTTNEITLKARGQAITTAVDVAEITRNRFVKELKVNKIAIGTAEMPPREGETRSRMVSTMEITLIK